MMNYNNNNIVLCGSSIEDLEAGMIALRSALATGAVMGVGGSSIEEVEAGLDELRQMVGVPHECPYQYDCATCDYCECEDEEDDYDPWVEELDDPDWDEDEDEEDEDEDEDLDPDDLPEPVKAVLSAILAALIDSEL